MAAERRPDLKRYAVLLFELALVLAALWVYRLRDVLGGAFFDVAAIAAGGFALHYWLPVRCKEWGFVGLSIVASFFLLDVRVAGLLLAVGLAFFAISRAPLPWAARVTLIAAAGIACAFGRAFGVPHVPEQFWPVLGSVFLFRLVVWCYDLKHFKGPASLRDYLAYFFMLPNWGCLLFPVVDFHTMRKSFLARDVHDVAQQGVKWMARGLVHLLIYDWIYYNKPIADPAVIDGPFMLLAFIVSTYLLYLRLSGTFHFVIGILHLFGYDLPETHRKYLLASSITDFWRRINIYWKDFMVKVVYFPVYFRLRRKSDVGAQLVATALVFAVTWFMHAAQTFWLTGEFLLAETDVAFWSVLGLLVMANLWLELRGRSKTSGLGPTTAAKRVGAGATGAAGQPAVATTSSGGFALHAVKVAGTFLLLATLWSMWNAKSFSQWFDLLTWWRIGD